VSVGAACPAGREQQHVHWVLLLGRAAREQSPAPVNQHCSVNSSEAAPHKAELKEVTVVAKGGHALEVGGGGGKGMGPHV
jgi:hypothetical protein